MEARSGLAGTFATEFVVAVVAHALGVVRCIRVLTVRYGHHGSLVLLFLGLRGRRLLLFSGCTAN